MTRLFKSLSVAGLAVLMLTVACATSDVSATAEGEGTLSTEAELNCCQQAEAAGKECTMKKCADKAGECDMAAEGKVCPVTGQKIEG